MSEELIYVNGGYQQPNSTKKEIDKAIENLVGAAPEELDTMHELAEAIKNNKIEVEAPLFVNSKNKISLQLDGSLLVDEFDYLCIRNASFNTFKGGVIIGTGYLASENYQYSTEPVKVALGGLTVNSEGIIGLLPPVIQYKTKNKILGGIKSANIHKTTPTIETGVSGKYYQIETDLEGNAFVKIPDIPESSGSGSVDIATYEKAGIIKLGTEVVTTWGDSSEIGLLNNAGHACVRIPHASTTNKGLVTFGMQSFNTSMKQPVGESDFSAGTGLGFPIGTGLASTGEVLHVNIGTGLIAPGNGNCLMVGLDEDLFTWNENKISINIDNLRTQLKL